MKDIAKYFKCPEYFLDLKEDVKKKLKALRRKNFRTISFKEIKIRKKIFNE